MVLQQNGYIIDHSKFSSNLDNLYLQRVTQVKTIEFLLTICLIYGQKFTTVENRIMLDSKNSRSFIKSSLNFKNSQLQVTLGQ